MTDHAPHKLLVSETLALLQHQLAQPQPCVAQASMILGTLQERLFARSSEPLQASVSQYMYRFQELFVEPAAGKLGKCKTVQDKVVAIAKFLRGKLAKAPAHKQPLHTQYLPSALRDSGKRQLDCLGIATAVLALCHHIAAQQPQQHAALAAAGMCVSDDHAWLAVPAEGPQAADAGSDQQQQQQVVFVEVTEPGVLAPNQLSGSWLYAAGHGTAASPAQVLMVLVAGLMPEELQDDAAAAQLREVQLALLATLAQAHPDALLYSNFFRWGMLHEKSELEQLAAAAEAAAASGDLAALQALALLPPAQLQSQQHYTTAMQRSSGWQWHPSSCATFGWLNRMQAALCGETDNLLCLSCRDPQQQQHTAAGSTVKPWLDMAVFLLQQALQAVEGCTAVLRRYSACAGKPNKAADTQLLEAVTDLWQNLADASKAVACLQQLAAQHVSQQQQVPQQQPHQQEQHQEPDATQQPDTAARASSPGGHTSSDVPAAAAVPSHTVHLAAAVKRAAAGSNPQPGTPPLSFQGVLSEPSWLRPQLEFLDALLCFFGEESADVPAGAVADFVTVAGTYSSPARQQAAADAVAQAAVHSSRVQGLVGSSAWAGMEPGLQQLLQMPGSRSRKKQRKD